MLAPVAPDFIGEGVLSSHAELVALLAGHFVMGLANVHALRQVETSCYSSGTSKQTDIFFDGLEQALTSERLPSCSRDVSSQSLRCDNTFTSYRNGKNVHGRFHVLGTSHSNSLFSVLVMLTFPGLTAQSRKMTVNVSDTSP